MPSTKPAAAPARPYHHGDLRRSLIDAAVELVAEEQDWNFSLREVARRAGVSHNAPYNHFAEKSELLSAVAVAGFETLRVRMANAVEREQSAAGAVLAIARTYVEVGIENPARYRLMFSSALAVEAAGRPPAARQAGLQAKAILEEVILRGARSGEFAIAPERKKDLDRHTLFAWSAVHGLTMLLIDQLARVNLSPRRLADGLAHSLLEGLRPR